MADQPNQAMTLREAVAHERRCPNEMDFHPTDCCDRARAIVDAAVLFVEDCEKDADGWDDAMLNGPFKKLRALERGEEPKP